MDPPPISGIERFSHLFLTLENSQDNPKIKKLPFDEQRELSSFFDLESNPFENAFDPPFNFTTIQHEKAYIKLRRCIEDGVSLGMLTAPGGMGKKLIIQTIDQSLAEENYKIAELRIERGLTGTAFLKNVLYGLGLADIYREDSSMPDLLDMLKKKIIAFYEEKGIRSVVLLSEAQFLTLEHWNLIKAISNIEMSRTKLTTTLLFGEDGLADQLQHKDLASIAGRIFIREHVKPLTVSETKEYLLSKLEQVNFKGSLFTSEAYKIIFNATGGICRAVNNLAHNALIEAFRLRLKIINGDVLMKCL